MTLRVLTIVGARPQFIKAATVTRAMRARDDIAEIMLHTGQHFDANMSQNFFDELDMPPPAYTLGIHGGTHGAMTGKMLEAIERVALQEEPDAVLVYGDTNSTLAGALGAAQLRIPLIHVEAGLRSYNRRMPEEINRIVADRLSGLLFCPTRQAVENLAAEGILEGVHHVGDVMYDAVLYARRRGEERSSIVERFGLKPGSYSVCTVHRAENTDDGQRFARIMDYLEREASDRPIIFPVHPRTRKLLGGHRKIGDRILLIDPVGYFDMHQLLTHAAQVLTDSGGLQKEAYFHRVPCVTLRDETEWVETVKSGWNRLWTVPEYETRCDIQDYGEGDAAARLVAIVTDKFR